MIKVICKDGIEPVKGQYPCIKATKGGRIVLFTAPTIGYELRNREKSTSFHWSNCWVEEDFQLYTGTVELSNEI